MFFVILRNKINKTEMNILAYNIHSCTQEKLDNILKRGADIMVLPECACPEKNKTTQRL